MTHTVKIRPRNATAWFYVEARRASGDLKLTTLKARALVVEQITAERFAESIERDNPGVAARAVPMFAGHGRSL